MNRDRVDDIIQEKVQAQETNNSLFMLGTDKLWGRLNDKMDARPARRINVVYYRLAAGIAAILIVVLAMLYIKPKHEDTVVSVPAQTIGDPVPKSTQMEPDAKEMAMKTNDHIHKRHTVGHKRTYNKSGLAVGLHDTRDNICGETAEDPSTYGLYAY